MLRIPGARSRIFILALIWGAIPGASASYAADLPFDTSQYENAAKLASEEFVGGVIKTISLLGMERPYQPASPLGRMAGLDLAAEATFVRLPDSFGETLKLVGAPNVNTPALPVPRLQIAKGLGDNMNIGASYINFKIFRIIGANAQYTFLQPEEYPFWAVRMTYSITRIAFVTTQTYSPQIVLSRPMDFADPYMGVGYIYYKGEVLIDVPQVGSISADSQGSSALWFMGVKLKVPYLGVKITLEGSYNISGAHTMGMAAGLAF